MGNFFCYIIARTPGRLRSPLREHLWRVCLDSLLAQQYPHWLAIIVGGQEDTRQVDKLHFIEMDDAPKGEKILAAMTYIRERFPATNYVARLDDDDIVSPGILQQTSSTAADCIADRWQWMYDIQKDRFIFHRYPWMANTVFHKRIHADYLMEDGLPLIAQDHSMVFHKYYTGKQVLYTRLFHPLYVRILSPTCLSLSNLYAADATRFDWKSYRDLISKTAGGNNLNRWHPLAPAWLNKTYRQPLRGIAKGLTDAMS